MALNAIYAAVAYCHDPNGNQMVNVWHYAVDEVEAGTDAFRIAQDIIDGWQTRNLAHYCDCLAQDVIFDLMACRRIYSAAASTAFGLFNQPGTEISNNDVSNACAYLSWIAGAGGQGLSGRTFMPGLPTDAHTGNDLTGAYITTLGDFATDMLLGVSIGVLSNATFVIYHRETHTWDAITSFQVGPKLGTQRKRLVPVY